MNGPNEEGRPLKYERTTNFDVAFIAFRQSVCYSQLIFFRPIRTLQEEPHSTEFKLRDPRRLRRRQAERQAGFRRRGEERAHFLQAELGKGLERAVQEREKGG